MLANTWIFRTIPAGDVVRVLLSVWVLVGLFYYLNRYTRREYFTIWTVAWLFYALWLTLGLNTQGLTYNKTVFILQQCCVAISAVFLLWGSARFLSLPVRQTLLTLFMLFLLVWTVVSPEVISDTLQIQLPVFILIGLGSVFAGVCFYRVRKKDAVCRGGHVVHGLSALGTLPGKLSVFPRVSGTLQRGLSHRRGVAAFYCRQHGRAGDGRGPLQCRTDARGNREVRSEKEALQAKILTTEEQYRNLYDQVRLTEGVQKAYDELRRTQQVVVQQERLRALGQMASGVAHDVNNALSPVVAYSELLLATQTNLPETARQYLQIIRRSGEDISHIVARMREFYRRRTDTEELTEVDINHIIEEVIELTRPRWRDLSQRQAVSIQVQRELDPQSPLLLSDPSELREALINLIFNAVDALPRAASSPWFRVLSAVRRHGDNPPERQIQIEVRDNGVGMDEKTRQHCLEPFFSTKAKRGGTGLGLAMVYGMMRRHDGNIEIESAPGQGTSIRLTFPVRSRRPRQLPQPPCCAPAPIVPCASSALMMNCKYRNC